ncbi:MAG: DNA-protecting protein DprA [Nitrospira sp.]|nr:DNA-protecting protein DprA [Nitrospira sp.]
MTQAFQTDQILTELNPLERKNAPERLFLEGDISLLTEGRRISVVGSRKVSEAGIQRAKAFTEALVRHNFVVVSGLAEGVDTVAHETAIRCGGKTIAVLGTPLDKVYPAKNKALLEKIKQDHLAISQFPQNYPSKGENFPRRNRTMALISDATVIVEAGEKSGTRHQGWEALRLGRLVFIMENVAENPALSWPREMINYGAQVLTREDVSEVLEDIPSFTAGGAVAF